MPFQNNQTTPSEVKQQTADSEILPLIPELNILTIEYLDLVDLKVLCEAEEDAIARLAKNEVHKRRNSLFFGNTEQIEKSKRFLIQYFANQQLLIANKASLEEQSNLVADKNTELTSNPWLSLMPLYNCYEQEIHEEIRQCIEGKQPLPPFILDKIQLACLQLDWKIICPLLTLGTNEMASYVVGVLSHPTIRANDLLYKVCLHIWLDEAKKHMLARIILSSAQPERFIIYTENSRSDKIVHELLECGNISLAHEIARLYPAKAAQELFAQAMALQDGQLALCLIERDDVVCTSYHPILLEAAIRNNKNGLIKKLYQASGTEHARTPTPTVVSAEQKEEKIHTSKEVVLKNKQRDIFVVEVLYFSSKHNKNSQDVLSQLGENFSVLPQDIINLLYFAFGKRYPVYFQGLKKDSWLDKKETFTDVSCFFNNINKYLENFLNKEDKKANEELDFLLKLNQNILNGLNRDIEKTLSYPSRKLTCYLDGGWLLSVTLLFCFLGILGLCIVPGMNLFALVTLGILAAIFFFSCMKIIRFVKDFLPVKDLPKEHADLANVFVDTKEGSLTCDKVFPDLKSKKEELGKITEKFNTLKTHEKKGEKQGKQQYNFWKNSLKFDSEQDRSTWLALALRR